MNWNRALLFAATIALSFAAPSMAQTVVNDPPPVVNPVHYLAANTAVSGSLLSGYLLREPAYLVTNQPVVQANAFLPVYAGCYLDVWGSTVIAHPGFGRHGDEWDFTGGCSHSVSAYDTVSGLVSEYLIAGSHNNILTAKLRYTHQFSDWSAYAEFEQQTHAGGIEVSIAHLGVTHAFALAGLRFTQDPEVSYFDSGLVTFADTLSLDLTTRGLKWSPTMTFSVPSHGKTYIVAGVSFNF